MTIRILNAVLCYWLAGFIFLTIGAAWEVAFFAIAATLFAFRAGWVNRSGA